MGNCWMRCFGVVNTKGTRYLSSRYQNSHVDIEFENLIEDDEVQGTREILTEEERNLLLNHRYEDLVQEQQRVDAKIDEKLKEEEEEARVQEEAFNAARQEAARAAKQAREMERQKLQGSKTQSNGSAKSWLGSDAADWEIATEDDFETFLETVKAKSETVRASVASMIHRNNPTTATTTPATNPVVKGQPTSSPLTPFAGPKSPNTIPSGPNTALSTPSATPSTPQGQSHTPMYDDFDPRGGEQTPSPDPQFGGNMEKTPGGGIVGAPAAPPPGGLQDGGRDGAVVGGTPGPESVNKASPRETPNEKTHAISSEGLPRLSHKFSTNVPGDNDSDVEWEAEFVSSESTPEPLKVPLTSSTSSSTPGPLPSSSIPATIPSSHSEPIRTGLPREGRTKNSPVANGKLPHTRRDNAKLPEDGQQKTSTILPSTPKTSVEAPSMVKPKKTLDIDIDKFLEELDFET